MDNNTSAERAAAEKIARRAVQEIAADAGTTDYGIAGMPDLVIPFDANDALPVIIQACEDTVAAERSQREQERAELLQLLSDAPKILRPPIGSGPTAKARREYLAKIRAVTATGVSLSPSTPSPVEGSHNLSVEEAAGEIEDLFSRNLTFDTVGDWEASPDDYTLSHDVNFEEIEAIIRRVAPAAPQAEQPPNKVAHRAVITRACRENRGNYGAFDVACSRLSAEYRQCLENWMDGANYHVVLEIEPIAAAPAEQQEEN